MSASKRQRQSRNRRNAEQLKREIELAQKYVLLESLGPGGAINVAVQALLAAIYRYCPCGPERQGAITAVLQAYCELTNQSREGEQ